MHDRTGLTTDTARLARERPPRPVPPTAAGFDSRWLSANFNLLHTRRMLMSSDLLYHEAADVRFLYQLLDLFFGYFHARGLAAHDRPYLELFRACLGEADRTQRVELYQELVRRTVAPIGPLWPPGSTAATVQGATPERVSEAPRFWDDLFDGRDQRPPPANPAPRRGAGPAAVYSSLRVSPDVQIKDRLSGALRVRRSGTPPVPPTRALFRGSAA